MARGLQELSITGADQFTDWMPIHGKFNLSITIPSAFSGTVTLQRRFGTSGPEGDLETYTEATQKQGEEFEDAIFYRIGVKAGEFVSGGVDVRLSF